MAVQTVKYVREVCTLKGVNFKTAAMLYENTFGTALFNRVAKAAPQHGFEIVGNIPYAARTADLTAEIDKIKAMNAGSSASSTAATRTRRSSRSWERSPKRSLTATFRKRAPTQGPLCDVLSRRRQTKTSAQDSAGLGMLLAATPSEEPEMRTSNFTLVALAWLAALTAACATVPSTRAGTIITASVTLDPEQAVAYTEEIIRAYPDQAAAITAAAIAAAPDQADAIAAAATSAAPNHAEAIARAAWYALVSRILN